ncbi:MAG: FAD-binding protein [Desulfatirhabdiaceae bacterium]
MHSHINPAWLKPSIQPKKHHAVSGWGRYPVIHADINDVETVSRIAGLVTRPGHAIAHGNGRSYGDSALQSHIIRTIRLNKILDFEPDSGVVTCESGILLSELIDVFLPRGYFLTITPGTRWITVGGAIASDVHGKNHHVSGCFSQCVIHMDVMLADGNIIRCGKHINRELFLATCGGMGLTGVILQAKIRLRRVNSSRMIQRIIPCHDLDTVFAGFEDHRQASYSVAWIDCLANGASLGRSILLTGEHADDGQLAMAPDRSLSVPVTPPGFFLNQTSVKLFNRFYYSRQKANSGESIVSLNPFFYPLDRIANWNRMYGRSGFTQYQCVIPKSNGPAAMQAILTRIAASGMASFLAVLKLLGPQNDNYLSFPLEGYTLALDFKIQKPVFTLLDELDNLVLEHGGRLYLAKDVRMTASMFAAGYPGLAAFRRLREDHDLSSRFCSRQSIRLGI